MRYLLYPPGVDAVSVTGSVETETNRRTRVKRFKKVCFGIGRSDPFIVLEDADPSSNCTSGAQSRLLNTGQSRIGQRGLLS